MDDYFMLFLIGSLIHHKAFFMVLAKSYFLFNLSIIDGCFILNVKALILSRNRKTVSYLFSL